MKFMEEKFTEYIIRSPLKTLRKRKFKTNNFTSFPFNLNGLLTHLGGVYHLIIFRESANPDDYFL